MFFIVLDSIIIQCPPVIDVHWMPCEYWPSAMASNSNVAQGLTKPGNGTGYRVAGAQALFSKRRIKHYMELLYSHVTRDRKDFRYISCKVTMMMMMMTMTMMLLILISIDSHTSTFSSYTSGVKGQQWCGATSGNRRENS